MNNKNNINNSRNQILMVVYFFWLASYLHIPYQTVYLISIGVNKATIGLIIGFYGLLQIICRIPLGLKADMGDKTKAFLVLGPLFLGCAALLRVFSLKGIGFLFANIFSGLAASTWVAYMGYFTNLYSEEQYQEANGLILSYHNFGMLTAFIIGTILFDKIGMKGLCIISFVCSFMAFIFIIRIKGKKYDINQKEKLNKKNMLQMVISKRLIIYSITGLTLQGIVQSTTLMLSTQIAKELGATNLQIGMGTILYMASTALCSYLSSKKIFTGIKGWTYIILGLFGFSFYLVAMVNLTSLSLYNPLQVFQGISMGFAFTNSTSEATAVVKAIYKNTGIALFQSIYAIGMTLCPIITGRITQAYSMQTAFYFLAGLSVLSIILLIIYKAAAVKIDSTESHNIVR